MNKSVHVAPRWANGSLIWKMSLPDQRDALGEAEDKIRAVCNLTDSAVRQIVFLNGAVGVDEGYFAWDGSWPYWSRPSYRINHDWRYLGDFMVRMRKQWNTEVSFHVNLTDVNVGLALTEETRAFFKKLRDNKCIYTRPKGRNAQPWFGLPYVPQEIPLEEEAPDGRRKLDASDIFAMVDYKQLWDSGLAREIIDGLFSRLPYVPSLLYVDVFGPVGWCIHPGYPDGALGHNRQTQIEGMRLIRDYIRKCGSDVAGESPDRLVDLDADYSWSHGGLSTNDYSRIGSGFGMGAMGGTRGAKGMHVYGGQGGYHIQCGESVPKMLLNPGFESKVQSRKYDGIREWGTSDDLVRGFYLTVIQELYHIGGGHVRLPGGPVFTRLDEACGRARINAVTVVDGKGTEWVADATGAQISGSCRIEDDTWAVGGKTVAGLDQALFNSVRFTVDVPFAGLYKLFVRYSSVGGGRVSLMVNEGDKSELNLPNTDAWHFYGDVPVEKCLEKGVNTVTVIHDRIFAQWSDGTEAVWDETGLKIWNDGMIFAENGDRIWPDSWSGEKRLFLYSEKGGRTRWTLPEGYLAGTCFTLHRLTAEGRRKEADVSRQDDDLELELKAETPYILVAQE